MIFAERVQRATAVVSADLAFACLLLAVAHPLGSYAQQAPTAASLSLPAAEASETALPLAEDRGEVALRQSLRRLGTTASVLEIVAHPDDEDGALLTYLSRGLGVRVASFTLTRGEGGQNAISAETYDALGLIRTNELLKADELYGVKQLWGTEADFGFSKTQEESFSKWTHERVLYDAVLAVRQERPQIIISRFAGAITDGHGHHQVSGEIAQEAFKAAADPAVFPDQFKKYGVAPWHTLAVYSAVPFAPVTQQGMYDYATGKWSPARFKNYVTGETVEGSLSADAVMQVGTRDPLLGRSYEQIAREGWGEQKSQNGGANPTLSGSSSSSYHLWAAVDSVKAPVGAKTTDRDLFHNSKVSIDTGLAALAALIMNHPPEWLTTSLRRIDSDLKSFEAACPALSGVAAAHKLTPIYRETLTLRERVVGSNLDSSARAGLLLELDAKVGQFESAFKELLGLDLMAFTARTGGMQGGGPGPGNSADETSRSVTPGEDFRVRVHTSQASAEARLARVWLESRSGDPWKFEKTATQAAEGPFGQQPSGATLPAAAAQSGAVSDNTTFAVHASANAQPTEPYLTRPDIEQAYYDLSDAQWRLRSFAPYPLAAWAEFTFDGLPIRLGQVVQTLSRVSGQGGVYEQLVVTPAIGVSVSPEARILGPSYGALPVEVTVHAQAAAEGTVKLKLPAGWRSEPETAQFHLASAGDTEPFRFSVTPVNAETGSYTIAAVVQSGGKQFTAGWRSIGYTGLRPYNIYREAQLETRKVDARLAPGLRIAYVMGTGDHVPEAIESLGVKPHLLTAAELSSADLSAWNVIVIGIRAYSARPDLTAAQSRLEAFVRQGGSLVVQYQSASFPAPLQLSMGRMAERVVDEAATVKLLDPTNSLLTSPNAITTADFDGWVEERGHSFLDSWDAGYTALTETADAGQSPQRGGLLVAHVGKGTYIYVAFALYRQFPELVPGAYRLMANLLSAGQSSATKANHPQAQQP
jgi:LmbE family N-acetylglucosaminyl deacetylase